MSAAVYSIAADVRDTDDVDIGTRGHDGNWHGGVWARADGDDPAVDCSIKLELIVDDLGGGLCIDIWNPRTNKCVKLDDESMERLLVEIEHQLAVTVDRACP